MEKTIKEIPDEQYFSLVIRNPIKHYKQLKSLLETLEKKKLVLFEITSHSLLKRGVDTILPYLESKNSTYSELNLTINNTKHAVHVLLAIQDRRSLTKVKIVTQQKIPNVVKDLVEDLVKEMHRKNYACGISLKSTVE